MNNTSIEANMLWIVRILRVEGGELNAQSVYERQKFTFHYSLETVTDALAEISKRGYHWSERYPGISDACIVIGEGKAKHDSYH
jgi:hypothetical protein